MVQCSRRAPLLSTQIRRTTDCSDASNIVLDARADGIIFRYLSHASCVADWRRKRPKPDETMRPFHTLGGTYKSFT
jgi:hypothetical protein